MFRTQWWTYFLFRYWNTTIKEQLTGQFSKGLDPYEEVTEDLKQKITDYTSPTSKKNKEKSVVLKYCDGRFLVLARVQTGLGIKFRSKLSYFLRWFNTHKMVKESAIIFQSEDVTSIGQRVKHMKIMDYAQGFIYKERG